MSQYTHVRGMLELETMARSTEEAIYMANTVLKHMPRITGSERDVEIYTTIARGTNSSSNVDEFWRHSNLYNDPHFPLFSEQSIVLATLYGDPRDRHFETTLRETIRFLNRLATRIWIQSCVVSVSDDYGKIKTITNPEYLSKIQTNDWARDLAWKWDDNPTRMPQEE